MKEGWYRQTLEQVCDLIKRGIAPKYTQDESQLLVVNQKCVRDHKINFDLARRHDQTLKSVNPERLLKIGDVLVNSTGTGTLGRVAQLKKQEQESVTVDTHVTIVRPDLSKFYLPFFGYAMIYIENEIKLAGEGTSGQTELSRIKLSENFFVSYPKDIELQKQIVAILDKAFAAIDTAKANAEQNLQNAKELFESYLQNIFENKGDEWENKPLSEVCDLIKRGSQPKYTESEAGEIVLNQKCIRDHKINLSVARKHNTNKKTINKERYIQLGDGLINSTGTGTLGRVAQVRELNFSAFVDTHITIVRPKKELFYLDFFGWALIYIEKIVQKSGEGASGQTELSRKVVEKFIISFPNEMKQQQQTAEKLDNLSLEIKKLEAIYTQKIADLEEMKKAILEKAFKGELTSAA